jgi:putative hydrolase of the HAD superfamily
MIRISAVLFDYGNVLSLPQSVADAQRLAGMCGLALAQFEERYWMLRVAYDRGELDAVAYWKHFRSEEGHEPTPALIAELTRVDAESWEHPNEATVRWAVALRGEHGLKTAILSNMPADVRAHLVDENAWLPAFDHMTFSCDVGIMKPAPGIYHACLAGVGLHAGECLFLDDRPENVDAARALGLHAVQFHSAAQVADELEGRFDLPALHLLR